MSTEIPSAAAPTKEEFPELFADPETGELSPTLQALNPRQRRFVWAMLSNGGNQTDAARRAGYGGSSEQSMRATGHRLAHDEKIQKAILEESHKYAGARLYKWMEDIAQIAGDVTQPAAARLQAYKMLLPRGGSIERTEHTVNVNRGGEMSVPQMIAHIKRLASDLGVDYRPMLQKFGYGDAVDVDFVEVPAAPAQLQAPITGAEGLEDLLR